jgi:phage terminase large subunit-like protein
MDNYILTYYQQIKDGRTVVGRWVELAYKMVVDGLDSKTFFYDAKKAHHSIDWIEKHCFHTEGDMAPNPLLLELWQKAFLSVIFGIVDSDGNRYFREILLVIARKNGKSLLGAAIARYVWNNDGFGTRVYNIAPKLDQAEIIYNSIWVQTTLDPEWQAKEARRRERDTSRRKLNEDDPTQERHRMTDLYIPGTNSTVKKIAMASRKSDGFNPSLTICDEIASWEGDKGLKQYEVLKSGMGSRNQSLLMSLTTSGYVNDSIYDELVKRSTRFLLGESKETRLFPLLYMIDDLEKWNDINELRKSNPNLGVSVKTSYLLEEIAIAEGSLSKKAEFMTKYCCIKQNSSVAWLRTEDVNKCMSDPVTLEDFRGCYCVGGIDLSRTTDLTSCCVVIEKDRKLYVFSKFYLPSERIDEASARDNLPYRIYIQRGLLEASG